VFNGKHSGEQCPYPAAAGSVVILRLLSIKTFDNRRY